MSREVARLSPDERLAHALTAYAQAKTGLSGAIVTDYAVVAYVEALDETGTPSSSYLCAVPKSSSWHALRGLALTLSDHIIRLRPTRKS